MDVLDDVGTRDDQVLVASGELRSAEVCVGQVPLLDRGSHRAVEAEDATLEGGFERFNTGGAQRHVFRF